MLVTAALGMAFGRDATAITAATSTTTVAATATAAAAARSTVAATATAASAAGSTTTATAAAAEAATVTSGRAAAKIAAFAAGGAGGFASAFAGAGVAFLIDDFEGAAQAALGAADEEEGANGVDGSALATDDFTHVCRVNAEFVNGEAVAIRRGDRHGVRAIDEPFDHVIQKGFHNGTRIGEGLSFGGRGRGFAGFFDKAGNGLGRLGTVLDPMFSALEVDGEVVVLFEGLIGADFLDEFSIAGAAVIRHNNAEHRRVLRPDSL